MANRREEIMVGLDLGTSKVCAVVGEVGADGEVDIIGVGSASSKGITRGIVGEIGSTVEAIEKAVQEAELMAGCSIREAYVNISGGHLQGLNSSGVVALKDHEVREPELLRVIDGARAIPLGTGQEVLHTLPRHFSIDSQESIANPLGLSGIRLEANVHLITAPQSALQNITKCTNQAGLFTPAVICDAIASSEAILQDDEKELGVALVDIGAGTTDIAIWEGGSVIHTAVLPVGGDHITRDISIGLRTPTPEAERIKIRFGAAKASAVRHDEKIRVSGVGGRSSKELSRHLLADIIEPRVEELFLMVQKEIRNAGGEDLLASGLVLTGGCTNLDGMYEVAEEVTGLPVRRGAPQHIGGLIDVVSSPSYSTGIGLILHALHRQNDPIYQAALHNTRWHRGSRRLIDLFSKMRRWLGAFF